MKKGMKIICAEKGHEHPWLVLSGIILFTIFCVVINLNQQKISSLEEEISTMPHYECWNESFQGFINKSEMMGEACFYYLAYSEEDLGRMSCTYNGYSAECKNDICYIDDIREVCKLNKDGLLGETD